MKTKQTKINEGFQKAADQYKSAGDIIKGARRSLLKVRACMNVLLLIFCVNISAQSFENINGLGKTTEQVKKLACSDINKFTFLNSGNENGKMYISYYSSDYGAIKYTFSKRNVCVKITISTIPNRYLKFTINRYEYAVREVLDNDKRLTEIIRL